MEATKLYRVEFSTRFKNIEVLDLIFEDIALATSSYEIESHTVHSEADDRWRYLLYTNNIIDKEYLLKLAHDFIEGSLSIFEEEPQDWVSTVQAQAKSIAAGKFYVSNAHLISKAPDDLIKIQIEAGRAFGTGEHFTTSGCLEMLSSIDLIPSAILDVGTGSGILAIGAKKLWNKARVIATEIDLDALEVAKVNAQINGVSIEFYQDYALDEYINKFDLIICNILANPLVEMSGDFQKMLKPNGLIIVSGFLENQKDYVLSNYESKNFILEQELIKKDWVIFCLKNS